MSIVREYCLTLSTLSGMSPEQVLFRVVISVEEVEDVKGYPNFLKDKEGQNLSLFYKRKNICRTIWKMDKGRGRI
jgi:hypothetical protein